MMKRNGKSGLILPGLILLSICISLAGCGKSIPTMTPAPCAAQKPTIDIVEVDGYFVISDADMGQLTGYMSALESGCTPPK